MLLDIVFLDKNKVRSIKARLLDLPLIVTSSLKLMTRRGFLSLQSFSSTQPLPSPASFQGQKKMVRALGMMPSMQVTADTDLQ